jgi:predicted nucleotidyltransferase
LNFSECRACSSKVTEKPFSPSRKDREKLRNFSTQYTSKGPHLANRIFQKILEDSSILSKYNLMRISQDQAFNIRKTIQARDPSATVSLFGSMADDQARGGDIDLLVRSNRLTLSDRLDIACELEDALGLRKIDLVIDNGRPNAFVRSIESRAIRL